MSLALKMTIKYYCQADCQNTWRLLECVIERKFFTNTQFMNFPKKKKKKREKGQVGYIVASQFGCNIKTWRM